MRWLSSSWQDIPSGLNCRHTMTLYNTMKNTTPLKCCSLQYAQGSTKPHPHKAFASNFKRCLMSQQVFWVKWWRSTWTSWWQCHWSTNALVRKIVMLTSRVDFLRWYWRSSRSQAFLRLWIWKINKRLKTEIFYNWTRAHSERQTHQLHCESS